MAIQLKPTSQLSVANGVKVIVYARAGMGKTMLCATAPNPVIISAESGLLSLRPDNIAKVFGANDPSISYDMPVIEVSTVQDLIEIEQWARQSNEAKQFQTICLDSITEIGEKILANAKQQVKDPRQAYGELIEKAVTTIKAYRDLKGFNVYMSAKEERVKDEGTGITLAGPAMPGQKTGPSMPYLYDEVFNLNVAKDMQTQQSYRYLRTQPDFNYDAKDRSGSLDEIEMPHLGYVFAKIMGQL